MSDEGMFRPPGAPGGELRPWAPPAGPTRPDTPDEPPPGPDATRRQPPPAPAEAGVRPPAGPVREARAATGPPRPDGRDDGEDGAGGAEERQPPRRGVAPDVAWRLAGVAAAALLYFAADLAWYRLGAQRCAQLYPIGSSDPAQRAFCERVALSAWDATRWGIWLALLSALFMLLRLAKKGQILLDLLAVAAAVIADLLALRAAFSPPGKELSYAITGPIVVLPLLAVLTLAAVQTVQAGRRSADLSWRQVGEQAREARLPGWLTPARVWQRRRWWALGAGAVAVLLFARGCASNGHLPGTAPGTRALPDGTGQSAQPGGQGPVGTPGAGPGTTSPAPPPLPDAATLLATARRALGSARSVTVKSGDPESSVQLDLRLTPDRRGEGTVTMASLASYDVRRVGSACWVHGLPGHLTSWVRTCTIPASGTSPALDVAAVTDWQVMVARLPDPASARTAERSDVGGTAAWQVTASGGTQAYLPVTANSGPLARVRVNRGHLGVLELDYDGWNDPVTIAPP